MPETPAKKSRRPLRTAFVLALIAVVFWFGHGPVLSWGLRTGLVRFLATQGVDARIAGARVQVGSPIRLDGVRLRKDPFTDLSIGSLEIVLAGPGAWFEKSGRWIPRLSLQGVEGSLNAADVPVAPPELAILPETIEVQNLSLDVQADDQRFSVRNFSLRLREDGPGTAVLREFTAQTPDWSKTLGPLQASTLWKTGVLSLGQLELQSGVVFETISVDTLQKRGPAASFRLALFGGTVRGDLTIGENLEAAVWASNVPLAPLPALAESGARVAGRLVEGRVTFRGDPRRPADAEASLRVVAEGVRWEERGWETLEAGASLIHRRLVVSDFDLCQKENRVHLNGEISLAEGWSKIAQAPFLFNIRANIEELGALGGLAGAGFEELDGRMSAAGTVSGREGQLDGFLSVEASNIAFRNLSLNGAKLEAVFKKSEVEIAQLEIYAGKDLLEGKGTIGLAAPHMYAGEITARVADLARYTAVVAGSEDVASGALDLRWQGDGTLRAHSGAFEIGLRDLVSTHTPAGLSGDFAGTYSPQNVYFSRFAIENNGVRLQASATMAATGVTLGDVELRTGRETLLEGGLFFPIDLFAMLGGTDWRAAIAADREAWISLKTPRTLSLATLASLFGQEPLLTGQLALNVDAGGVPASMWSKGSLTVNALRYGSDATFPESKLDLTFLSGAGGATLDGSLATRGFRPLTLRGRMPFGLTQTGSGDWRWVNPDGSFDLTAEFPRTDISVFRPLIGPARRIAGDLSGRIHATGTIAAPVAEGRLDLSNGLLEISARTPPVTNLNAAIVFDGTQARVETFRGEVGAGPFSLSGTMAFAGPQFDLRFKGDKVLLARDAGMRLRANIDLAASGGPAGGSVAGSIRLVDGRIYRRLEVTPLLVPTPAQQTMIVSSPVPPGMVPSPFDRWTLDVKVQNETPFLLKGNLADGEIIPALTFTGTLGDPVPIGRIQLRDVRAFLPFTTLDIPDGQIDFLPDIPWMPMLDIRGRASLPDYDVQAYVFGPLNENKIILRSEPPLPQESLVLLLTTGIAPGATSGAGFGEAAVGQGGLFLLRALAREVNLPGIDMENFVNRLSLTATSARYSGEATALRGTFQLWNEFGLLTGRDHNGFYQGGVTYTWRFR